MKKGVILLTLVLIILSSCRSYIDIPRNSISKDYLIFKYENDYNNFIFSDKVNIVADKDVSITTHFNIRLPKKIIYWMRLGNRFFFEYSTGQLICVYSSYANKEGHGDEWKLFEPKENDEFNYLDEYFEKKVKGNKRKNRKAGRITKVYTNSKYEILLYNIKKENFK